MGLLATTTKNEFRTEVIESDKLILVDFWANWCPPCRAMAPILEKIAKEHDADINIVKIDVEASVENNTLAMEHGVQGIPNMQVFKNGKKVDELVGMRSESILVDELQAHL